MSSPFNMTKWVITGIILSGRVFGFLSWIVCIETTVMIRLNQLPEEVNRVIVNQLLSINGLEAWLGKHGISYDGWGRSNSKKLRHLWQELEAGEVQLRDNPPLRVVDVVQIIIRQGEKILIEAEQEFFNGQRRFRNQPPSEKIKPGESVMDAARRCLLEELGVSPENIVLNPDSHREHQTNTNSISYPGLPSQYNFHLLEAAVSGLPQDDFWRENKAGGEIDPVKRHRWVWQPMDSIKFVAGQ
jgi:NUDIX domain